jgi:uncharacterized lipoprotein
MKVGLIVAMLAVMLTSACSPQATTKGPGNRPQSTRTDCIPGKQNLDAGGITGAREKLGDGQTQRGQARDN